MRRNKTRAGRRVRQSTVGIDGDVVPPVTMNTEEPGPSKNFLEVAKAGNEREKDADQEIDYLKEEFEEVDNVVSAFMEMEEISQQNQIKSEAHVVEKMELVAGEPSAARIEIMEMDGHIDDLCGIKVDEGGEKQQESRDDQKQNEGNEVSEVNEVPPVFNQESLTEWKKEKQLELYVGGLHKDADEQDLFEIFGKFGEVKVARIIRSPNTNRSRRFGFIQYATLEQVKKVLSDLKDGIEVRGKRVKVSIGKRVKVSIIHARDILYVGNICKRWTKEDVLDKLKACGIESFEEIQVPNDPKKEGMSRGFAFLRFSTFSEATAALNILRKPGTIFGRAGGAKVAFARTHMHPKEAVILQVRTIYVKGMPKSWDVKKLKAMCEQYGEIKKVKILRNFGNKGKDFGFISFANRESAVACVKGMNTLQFGEGIKVKADIFRSFIGGHLQKSTCARLQLNKRLRRAGGWKMIGNAKSEGVERKSDMKVPIVTDKSKTKKTEEQAAAVAPKTAHKFNQDPSKSKRMIKDEKYVKESIACKAPVVSDKPNKFYEKSRKRQRGKMNVGSHGQPNYSSRHLNSLSHLQDGPRTGTISRAYRITYEVAYAASPSGYPVYAHIAAPGSKRQFSDLEPHAGFMQPVQYLKLDTQYERQPPATYERQPPATYFKPAFKKEALPQAGFFESAFIKRSFGIDDFLERRTGDHNGGGSQGHVYWAGQWRAPQLMHEARTYPGKTLASSSHAIRNGQSRREHNKY